MKRFFQNIKESDQALTILLALALSFLYSVIGGYITEFFVAILLLSSIVIYSAILIINAIDRNFRELSVSIKKTNTTEV